MKKDSKLYSHLKESGVLENGTPSEIEDSKMKFRRYQDSERLKEYRSKFQRKEVYFSKKEMEQVASAAKKLGMKVGTFIRVSTMAYINSAFVLPSDSAVCELELAFRKIGNNINQLTKHVHQRGLYHEDIESFKTQLNYLENEVSKLLREPLNLEAVLIDLVSKDPDKIAYLQRFVDHLKKR